MKISSLVGESLASSQYANRKERSTETLHHLVNKIEVQLAAKRYDLDIFLDIKGAFDSISNASIKEIIDRHETPETIVDWTLNMLTGRSLTVSQGDLTLRGCLARGYPQEEILSPLL